MILRIITHRAYNEQRDINITNIHIFEFALLCTSIITPPPPSLKKRKFDLRHLQISWDINYGGKKILVLKEGITISEINGNISELKFTKSDFDISKFSTKTTVTKKIQETSTKNLIECLIIFHKTTDKIELSKKILVRNCGLSNLENIHQELYSRLVKPFYITFLIVVSLLLILKSKSNYLFSPVSYTHLTLPTNREV